VAGGELAGASVDAGEAEAAEGAGSTTLDRTNCGTTAKATTDATTSTRTAAPATSAATRQTPPALSMGTVTSMLAFYDGRVTGRGSRPPTLLGLSADGAAARRGLGSA
jgi:hypothetical protein